MEETPLLEKELENQIIIKSDKKKIAHGLLKRLIFYPVFFLIALFVMFTILTNLIYFPMSEVEPTTYTHEDIFIPVENKQKINAWYIKAKEGFPTIIFSHGNGGNIGIFFPFLQPAIDRGFGVLIYDYRGYGKSNGRPFETGMYKDLQSAVNYLNSIQNIKNEDIILWGLSIGGGVTAEIASKNTFRGVILQSTFSSIRDLAICKIKSIFFRNTTNVTVDKALTKIVYSLPIVQKYETKNKIVNIKPPLLLLHSKEDELIPYYLAEINYSNNPSAQFFLAEDGGHNDSYWADSKVLEFLDSLK